MVSSFLTWFHIDFRCSCSFFLSTFTELNLRFAVNKKKKEGMQWKHPTGCTKRVGRGMRLKLRDVECVFIVKSYIVEH